MQFSSVVGQEIVKGRLMDGFHRGRIPHAQLFVGGEGTGALPLALAYAQFMLCENPTENDSCGVCGNCKKTTSFTHPDVHFTFPFLKKKGESDVCSDVYSEWREALKASPYMTYEIWMKHLKAENKQGNIPVDECRAIIRNLSLKAFGGGYKILVMWLPEFLGQQGNILLKLIEEPPQNTLFLLVAEDADNVLNTIVSRTQLVRIPPVSDEAMMQALMEKEGLTEKDARKLAMVAAGNYATALELLHESNNPFLEPWMQWLGIAFNMHMGKAATWSDEMSGLGREGLKSFLLYGLQLLRAAAVSPYEINSGVWDEKEADLVNRLVKLNLGADRIELMVKLLENSMYEIERNGNVKMILLDASYRLSHLIRKTA